MLYGVPRPDERKYSAKTFDMKMGQEMRGESRAYSEASREGFREKVTSV